MQSNPNAVSKIGNLRAKYKQINKQTSTHNSKLKTDLTIILAEENIGEKLWDPGLCEDFCKLCKMNAKQ